MRLPFARARAGPDCVRSTGRSRSNCTTAVITPIVMRPADEVSPTPPSTTQYTRTPVLSSRATLPATSIAPRPSRSAA
jgi:hypothetical protein